jgi:hypothetical protein
MSVTKRILGNYNITNKDSTGSNVTISTSTVYIDGNLIVGGNSTSVSKTDLKVTDNTIVLNSGETGAGVTLDYSGIEIDRGISANVGLRWDETLGAWQATEDGTTWKYILQGNTAGGLSNVSEDTDPALGGNLNITGYTLYNTSANVTIYTSTPASGGSGVFANTATATNQELVTKTKAIVYALIM